MREAGDYFALGKGYHSIRIEYFQGLGGIGLEFYLTDKDNGKIRVAPDKLYH